LQGIIQRFEDEYPECRISNDALLNRPPGGSSTAGVSNPISTISGLSVPSLGPSAEASALTSDDEFEESRPSLRTSRHNSDVSLASRALSREEGRIHRVGQKARRSIVNAPGFELPSDRPMSSAGGINNNIGLTNASETIRDPKIASLAKRIEALSGPELKTEIQTGGWEGLLEKMGTNFEELRRLQEEDPVAWEQFKESQLKATANMERTAK